MFLSRDTCPAKLSFRMYDRPATLVATLASAKASDRYRRIIERNQNFPASGCRPLSREIIRPTIRPFLSVFLFRFVRLFFEFSYFEYNNGETVRLARKIYVLRSQTKELSDDIDRLAAPRAVRTLYARKHSCQLF